VAFEGACVGAFADGAGESTAASVLLPPRCRRHQAATDVTLSRCRHHRSIRAAATALPPSRCAPPPRFALLPPPLTLPPRRRQASADVALARCRHHH
jgi:hypothetical protein